MMLRKNRQVEDEAIAWVVRLRDAREEDWEAFTAWLEADEAHAAAYDEVALADAEAEQLLPPPREAPAPARIAPFEPAPSRRHGRRAFLGWGIAASLLLVTAYATTGDSDIYAIETGAGERRQIALEDGSRIELNGASRIFLDKDRPRFARLERGEALFRVVHDSARPFEVEAGDALLRDMGTVFNVVSDRDTLEVSVSEGAVLYNPSREATNLTPGMGLRRTSGARPWVGKIDPAAVAGWTEGRLVYAGAPISRVAADLSRNTGLKVSAAGSVEDRPFSGIIILGGERREVVSRAASLLGVGVSRKGDGLILGAGTSATE